MPVYPTELMPTANGVMSYVLTPPARSEGDTGAEAAWDGAWPPAVSAFAAAQLRPSPVDKIVGAFDALKDRVSVLDGDGLAVLASCAEQIVINGFHGKGAEALAVRDAAIALLSPPSPPEGELR